MSKTHPGEVLVVAPHLPQADACAGDWRIAAFCRALAARRPVALLPIQPCSEAAIDERWRTDGIRIIIPGTNAPADFSQIMRQNDFAAVVFEWFYTAHHFRRFLPQCPRVIIDTHELYFLKAQRMQETLGTQAVTPGYPEDVRTHELAMYRSADLLLAISEDERDILQKEFPKKNILVLPMWTENDESGAFPPFEVRKDIVFLGSFLNPAQSPNADAVRYFTGEILPRIARALPEVRFHVAGFASEEFRKAALTRILDNYIIFDGKVRDIAAYLAHFRVFVGPLRFGAGVKKKILDAAIAGCPVVTTPVGNEGTGLIDGTSILVAVSPDIFARKVVQLYTDRNLWCRIADAARESVLRRNNRGTGIEEIEQYLSGINDITK